MLCFGNQSDDHNHTVTISTHNGHKHSIDDPGHAHSYIDTIGELINDEEGEDEKGEHAINEQTTKTTQKCKHWYQRNSKCGSHSRNAVTANQASNHNHTITVPQNALELRWCIHGLPGQIS